jgi:hypothetical protein
VEGEHMTALERLVRRVWWVRVAIYLGVGLFLIGILVGIGRWQQASWPIALSGFAVAFVASMAGYYVCLRCPRCQGNLGTLFMYAEWLSVRFCPYCGTNLDE